MGLSIVCTARNDNYEGDFVGRFIESIDKNCKSLEKFGIDYEYLNTEWNPQTEFLSQSERSKHLFCQYRVHNYIVDRSVVEAEGLHPTKFYEYYAKNTGIRRASKTNVLVTNPDIVFGDEMVGEINRLIKSGLSDSHFYRARYRNQLRNEEVVEIKDLYEPQNPDGHLMGGYSGDFLLVKTFIAQNIMKGYDEVGEHHRKGWQTSCDGEGLFQLSKCGINLISIDKNYYHLYHGKHRVYDSSAYNQNGYNNPNSWGFIDYPTKQIDEKTTLIYSNQEVVHEQAA